VEEEGDSFKSENEKEIFQNSNIMSVEEDQQHVVVN
jgi:hypothetical protein